MLRSRSRRRHGYRQDAGGGSGVGGVGGVRRVRKKEETPKKKNQKILLRSVLNDMIYDLF